MRRVLAEGMGWEVRDGTVIDRGGGISPLRNWHPWDNWPQCGQVIEKMRGKGWDWHVSAYANGRVGVTLRHEETNRSALVSILDDIVGERHARMLAAARALEAANV